MGHETDISNTADVIDVRDITPRIEELEGLRDAVEAVKANRADMANASPEEIEQADDAITDAEAEFDEDAQAELAMLLSLMEDLKGNGGDEQWRGDWYPLILVRDSHFKDFAQEEAESLDLIKADMRWPYTCIDWDQAATELQSDYTTVEYDGETYWYR